MILLLLFPYFTVIIVIIIIVLSIISVVCFILSHFISYCLYLVCELRVTCVSSHNFFSLFWLMIKILYSHYLYLSRNIFLLPLSFISSLSSSQSFYFFQRYFFQSFYFFQVIGGEFSKRIRTA